MKLKVPKVDGRSFEAQRYQYGLVNLETGKVVGFIKAAEGTPFIYSRLTLIAA